MLPIGEQLAMPPPQLPGNVGPQPTAEQPPAAADPATVQQNYGLWKGFFNRLKTDPNFQKAVVSFGTGLMKTPQMGQSGYDVASSALTSGMTTLDALRERDKTQAIETGERTRKAGLEGRQVAASESQARSTARNAATQEQAVTQQGEASRENIKLAKDELEAAIANNEEQNKIARLRANYEGIRARAYGDRRAALGGAELKKMEALSRKFQAQGMDEIDADDAAVRYLEREKAGGGKDLARFLFEERVKAYSESLEALDKPMNAEMARAWLLEAKALAKEAEPPAATPQGGPQGTGAGPGRVPTGAAGTPAAAGPTSGGAARTAPDPQIQTQIKAALARGVEPAQIKARLIELGADPTVYGY